MAKKASRALMVRPDQKRNDGPPGPEEHIEPEGAEKVPEIEHLLVPAALLLAADLVSGHDDTTPWLNGVYLHSVDGVGRAVATDGARMFVSSFPIAEPVSWLEDGVILTNEGLKERVSMIAKMSGEAPKVRISYAKDGPGVQMSDLDSNMVFQMTFRDGAFPDYSRVIPPESFVKLDEDGAVSGGREWEPVGINSAYLKHVGETAKILDKGLPKATNPEDRKARAMGMMIRAFTGGGTNTRLAPLVFDFSLYPGAIMLIMPAKLAPQALSKQTSALLAPALKGSLAALRAHQTRNLAWAGEATTDEAKAGYLAKAEGFAARIRDVLGRVPAMTAIEAAAQQEAEPIISDEEISRHMANGAAEPEIEPEAGEIEPEAGETDGEFDAHIKAHLAQFDPAEVNETHHDETEQEAAE